MRTERRRCRVWRPGDADQATAQDGFEATFEVGEARANLASAPTCGLSTSFLRNGCRSPVARTDRSAPDEVEAAHELVVAEDEAIRTIKQVETDSRQD